MMKPYDITIFVLALTTDTAIYFLHGGNKKALSPYRSLTGGNTFCKAECDNDPDCNGYSINSTGCFISRCDTYQGVSRVNLPVKTRRQVVWTVCKRLLYHHLQL